MFASHAPGSCRGLNGPFYWAISLNQSAVNRAANRRAAGPPLAPTSGTTSWSSGLDQLTGVTMCALSRVIASTSTAALCARQKTWQAPAVSLICGCKIRWMMTQSSRPLVRKNFFFLRNQRTTKVRILR